MSARISISSVVPAPFQFAGAGEVSEDLKAYLIAIYSYPDHVAQHPSLTFHEHLLSILEDGKFADSGSPSTKIA